MNEVNEDNLDCRLLKEEASLSTTVGVACSMTYDGPVPATNEKT